MKKEYCILAFVIIALCTYLFLHKENKTNYTLPKITAVKIKDIARLNINKGARKISFTKEDGNWFVTDKKYPADKEKVKSMLNVIAKLSLSDLVSQNNDLARYELDPKHRINTIAKNDSGDILRQFNIGKTAPTYRHTFVTIGNDNNVYYANGNFRSDFDYDVDGFRDKVVLSFQKDTIKKLAVEEGKKQRNFIFKETSFSENSGKKLNKEEGKSDKQNSGTELAKKGVKASIVKKWESGDNSYFNTSDIKDLLSELYDLHCSRYIYKGSKSGFNSKIPLCAINLKAQKGAGNEHNLSISIYPANKDGDYPAISSANKYPFLLDSYEGKDIVSKVNSLLGIKKKAGKKKGSK